MWAWVANASRMKSRQPGSVTLDKDQDAQQSCELVILCDWEKSHNSS